NKSDRRGRTASTRYAQLALRSSAGPRPVAISDHLRRSTLIAGRATPPLREAMLLVTMVNHPALLETHLDRFAQLELSRDLDGLRTAILAAIADGHPDLRETLSAEGFGPLVGRLRAQVEAAGVWQAAADAADRDAEEGWLQALTLHLRTRTLH